MGFRVVHRVGSWVLGRAGSAGNDGDGKAKADTSRVGAGTNGPSPRHPTRALQARLRGARWEGSSGWLDR